MALIYICDVCETEYKEVSFGTRLKYMDGNKVVDVLNESDPCHRCKTQLAEAEEKTKQEIKVKAGQTREKLKFPNGSTIDMSPVSEEEKLKSA